MLIFRAWGTCAASLVGRSRPFAVHEALKLIDNMARGGGGTPIHYVSVKSKLQHAPPGNAPGI